MDLHFRHIRPEYQEFCQTLDCGPEPWSVPVTTYLRTWYWSERERRRPAVILAITDDDELFGYGSWRHRKVDLDDDEAIVIFIPWFGIQDRFRGERLESGESAAGVLYATLEDEATTHQDSDPDMALVLDCHADNARGLAFWSKRGFEHFDVVETPSGRYFRMRR